MDLDGPVTVFRWLGAPNQVKSMVFADRLPVVMQIPYAQGINKGMDHAEGMTLFGKGCPGFSLGSDDSASKERQKGKHAVEADIFDLPR